MRIYTLVVGVLLFANSKAQTLVDSVMLTLKTERLISQVLKHPEFVKHKILSVDSDFNVKIHSGLINNKEAPLIVVIYSKADSFFLVKVSSLKMSVKNAESEGKVMFSKLDTAMALSYVAHHNEKYYSLWSLNDLVGRKNGYHFGVFGDLCGGYAPHVTSEAIELSRLVKEKSVNKLKDLASSFSKQERAFGTAGLFFLVLQGDRLNNDLLDLIGINQESELIITTCNGDIIEYQTMKEAFNVYRLKAFFSFLKEQKLL